MPKTIIVVNALIKNKDKFLVIKRKASSKIHPGLWMFPGGKVEEEEDIISALKREVKEETNLDITILKKLSDFEYPRPDGNITLGQCFLASADSTKVKINEELEDYTWITKEDFKNYSHLPELDNEINKAFSLLPKSI